MNSLNPIDTRSAATITDFNTIISDFELLENITQIDTYPTDFELATIEAEQTQLNFN